MTRSSIWLAIYAIGGLVVDGHIRPRQYDPEQGGDCTELSFSFPVWNIYDPLWTRINASTGGTSGDFRFGVHSVPTNTTVFCLARNINLFPQTPADVVWQPCNDSSTEFWPNLTANVFGLRQRWSCNGSKSLATQVFWDFSSSPSARFFRSQEQSLMKNAQQALCWLADSASADRSWLLQRCGQQRRHLNLPLG